MESQEMGKGLSQDHHGSQNLSLASDIHTPSSVPAAQDDKDIKADIIFI